MSYQVLRRPLGSSASENEVYDDFDCSQPVIDALVASLRLASPDWWYTAREARLVPREALRRFW